MQINQEEFKRLYPQLADKPKLTREFIDAADIEANTPITAGSHLADPVGLVKRWWFPIELTNGNKGRGFSWHAKAKERKELYRFFVNYFGGHQYAYRFPVEIVITRILGRGQRKWDSDSILRGNAKEILDSLKAIGWFHDDSPKWITKVTGRQDDTTRDSGPAIEILVIRSGV